jgi:hypothetical protein
LVAGNSTPNPAHLVDLILSLRSWLRCPQEPGIERGAAKLYKRSNAAERLILFDVEPVVGETNWGRSSVG